MNYIWTEADIKCGRIVYKPRPKWSASQIDGWDAKWLYKIGFSFWSPENPTAKSKKFLKVSLCDGMVSQPKTAAEMVEWLNTEGMAPCPHIHLIKVMDYLRDCYE